MNLIFATSNAHKVKEIASVLPQGYTVQSLKDIGFTEELPETRATIEGNSLQKAEYLAQKLGVACFAEDTGLEIAALNGAPGVYSARYAGPNATFTDNINKVLLQMAGQANRSARFKTVITYFVPESLSPPKSSKGDLDKSIDAAVQAPLLGGGVGEGLVTYYNGGKYVQFTGLCPGSILTAPRGSEGFGYDPIFVPTGCNLSFAQMRLEVKNQYSHRKKAVEQFLRYLNGD